MIIMKDIAKKAGVSIATVSLALNNSPKIAFTTAERIKAIAKELEYIPNASGQMLKTKHSKSFAIIVGQLSNHYHIDMITSIEEEAQKHGYQLFICNANLNWEHVYNHIRSLQSRSVDGILLSVSSEPDKNIMNKILKVWNAGLPILSLSSSTENYPLPIISFDIDSQLRVAMEYIYKLGHRNIGMIAAPPNFWINIRLDIFTDITKKMGIYNEKNILYADLNIDESKHALRTFLLENRHITAIYAVNDMMALGVLNAADDLGIKVPEDISVLGSDGIQLVNFTKPKLATIKAPLKEIGTIAAKKLLQMIADKSKNENERELLPSKFVIGGSIAKAKKTN